MSDKMSDTTLITVMLAILVALVFGGFVGGMLVGGKLKRDAVKGGHARYVAGPDEFEWNDCCLGGKDD